MLMHCLEWWLYEIGGFLAGIISEVELGANSIVYELAVIAYVVISLHCSLISQDVDEGIEHMHSNVIFV